MYWTSCYASILGLVFFYLSLCVIRERKFNKISLGNGKNQFLEQKIRAHANFAEYTPIALILILLIEMNGVNPLLIHGAGISLLLGRILHAYSFSRDEVHADTRVLGMKLTFIAIFIGSLSNLYVLFLGPI